MKKTRKEKEKEEEEIDEGSILKCKHFLRQSSSFVWKKKEALFILDEAAELHEENRPKDGGLLVFL